MRDFARCWQSDIDTVAGLRVVYAVEDAIQEVQRKMSLNPTDPHVRAAGECHLASALIAMHAEARVSSYSLCLFDDYTVIRNLDRGGAVVRFTNETARMEFECAFCFSGNLLTTWAKEQLRLGIGMVSFRVPRVLRNYDLPFHLITEVQNGQATRQD